MDGILNFILWSVIMGPRSNADVIDPLFWSPLGRNSRYRSPAPEAKCPPLAEREALYPLRSNTEPQ
jgi:hypothetical protein